MAIGPGTVVGGRYRVEHELGTGGMGAVWAGTSLADGSRVALKTLLEASKQNRELVTRFRREADFLARVQSPYVSKVVDFLPDPEHGLVLVMELIDGESLKAVLARGPLGVEEAIEIAKDVLAGLAELGKAQIVHRDLKPGNLITQREAGRYARTVIVDFGMSRFAGLDEDGDEITALTRVDIAVGTMEYMSPEQILNSRGATAAADIYALGAMLYRAVAGVHVFGDLEDVDLARHKLITDPPALMTGRTDALARGFEAVVTKMVQRKPEQRYQQADEVLAALARLEASGEGEPDTTQMANPARSHPVASSPVSSQPMASSPMASSPMASSPVTPVSSPSSLPSALVRATTGDAPAPKQSGSGFFVGLAALLLVAVAGGVLAWQRHWIALPARPAEQGPVIEAIPEPAPERAPAPPSVVLAPLASAAPVPSASVGVASSATSKPHPRVAATKVPVRTAAPVVPVAPKPIDSGAKAPQPLEVEKKPAATADSPAPVPIEP